MRAIYVFISVRIYLHVKFYILTNHKMIQLLDELALLNPMNRFQNRDTYKIKVECITIFLDLLGFYFVCFADNDNLDNEE